MLNELKIIIGLTPVSAKSTKRDEWIIRKIAATTVLISFAAL
jgi:hypothetical protein